MRLRTEASSRAGRGTLYDWLHLPRHRQLVPATIVAASLPMRILNPVVRQFLAALAFLVLGLAPHDGHAQGSLPVEAGQMGDEPIVLTRHFGILEDPGGALTLADIQRAPAAHPFATGHPQAWSLNFGVASSAYWLRLELRNSSDRPVERMLELAYPRLSASIRFYQPDKAGGYKEIDTGYLKPIASRAYKHHHYVFPVALDAGETRVVFFRFQSPNNLEIPGQLWTRDAFHESERAFYMTQMLYFGIVLAMSVFYLLLYLAMRDANYVIYVAFICIAGLSFAANNGLAIEYLWGDSPLWVTIGHAIGYCLSTVLLAILMMRMVPTRELAPRLHAALTGLVVVDALMIFGLVYSFPTFVKPFLIVVGLVALFVVLTGIACCLKGNRSAYLFLGSFFILCGAAVVSALRGLGYLPTNVFTTDGVQFGSAVHMLALAFSLADRYNQLRQAKDEAQAQALGAEQQLVENLRQSERVLEARVSERTAELSATVTQLKQAQAELVQAEKLASLGSLVAGVAHELNTPIGNALMTATTLDDAANDTRTAFVKGEIRKSALAQFLDNATSMTELIVRSCRRAADLISSFKQIAVDQTSERQRQFDLRTLVDDILATLRPGFKNAPWVITVDVPEGITCDSYPGPLGQIISNLVMNAIAHGFDGRDQGTVTVRGSATGEQINLWVDDDGKGMDPPTLAKIFDPFFTTNLGKGGSGLGLSISHNLATGMLRGTLSASAEAGKGSSFHLSFPRVSREKG